MTELHLYKGVAFGTGDQRGDHMGKALFLHGAHDARVAPFNLREGQPGEALLEVAAVGLCGSDLHYYKDGGIGSARILAPFVPGADRFTPEEAVMLEPLGVAIHAVDLAKPRLLERVALVGCGPIGLLILQVLKAAGAGEILAVDPQPHRRDLATKLGATRASASVAEIRDWTKGEGCPLVVEATNAPEGFRDAVLAARIGGRVVLVGIPDGDTYTLPAAEARRRGLKIKFARRMGDVYPRAIELVATGKVDVNVLVSHRFTLDEAPEAFRLHAEDAPGMVKSIIFPNDNNQGRRS